MLSFSPAAVYVCNMFGSELEKENRFLSFFFLKLKCVINYFSTPTSL